MSKHYFTGSNGERFPINLYERRQLLKFPTDIKEKLDAAKTKAEWEYYRSLLDLVEEHAE